MLGLLLLGGPAVASGPLFELRTEVHGLDYRNLSGSAEQLPIIEQNGQGLALFDYDGDGWIDLLVSNGGTLERWRHGRMPGPRLYRNLGAWRFEDTTTEAGIAAGREWGTGCSAADYDADGDLDVYLLAWGGNRLFRNDGDGGFSDVTDEAGVGEEVWSSSAAFADFDGDGLLDLYVTNYVRFDPERVPMTEADGSPCLYRGVVSGCGPWRYHGIPDTLYLQTRPGRFVDVSSAWGLDVSSECRSMGLAPGDFDRDGDADLYVGCDVGPNLYLENVSKRGFRTVGRERGGALNGEGRHESGMGVAAVDLFGRGELDVLTTNFAGETNTYYQGDRGLLTDRTAVIGFDRHPIELGWGVVPLDFDLDGDRDVLVANGHIYPQVEGLDDPLDRYRQPPRIYLGTPDSTLVERTRESLHRAGCDRLECLSFSLRAVAYGDLDNDGDLDLVAVQHNGPLVLFENRASGSAPLVELRTRSGGASPHGARLVIGAWSWDHWPTSGYQASHDPRVQLPAGARGFAVVTWPDGTRERFPVPPAPRRLEWRQGRGAAAP